MSDIQVSRLVGFFSPVAVIRTIVSSIWSPIDSILRYFLGIPGRICLFGLGCARLAISPVFRLLESYENPSPPSSPVSDPNPSLAASSVPDQNPSLATSQNGNQAPILPAATVPNLPYLLTGVPNPTCEQVSQSVRCIHNSAINVVMNHMTQRSKLQEYRNELQKWKEENEKGILDLYNLDDKDRITMKTLALAVKRLKVLKAKKTKFAKMSHEKMLKAANKNSLTSEDLKVINESNKNLTEIESEMNKNKKECLDMVKTSERLSNLFTKVLLHSDSFNDYTLDTELPLNSIVNRLRAITYKSQLENDSFKSSLVVTNEKLDKILNATERISAALSDFREEMPDIPSMKNELAALRSQLEQEQMVLSNVRGERDILKVKLDVLEDLIEDQEDFLNSRSNLEVEETVA